MQWSVQPENRLDLTKSKLNMDHSQRSRFMTNIREKYESVRINQNRNLFLIWFLDYSSRCESSWCILGPSWYTSKKIRSIWLCWGCPSNQKQTYRYTRRFQDERDVFDIKFFFGHSFWSFFGHFLSIFDRFSIRVPHAVQYLTLHHPIGVLFVYCNNPFALSELRVRQKWYHASGTLIHQHHFLTLFFHSSPTNHHSAFIKIDEKYAERAVESLNNCYFFGKQIKVQYSKQNPNSSSSSNQVLWRHFYVIVVT